MRFLLLSTHHLMNRSLCLLFFLSPFPICRLGAVVSHRLCVTEFSYFECVNIVTVFSITSCEWCARQRQAQEAALVISQWVEEEDVWLKRWIQVKKELRHVILVISCSNAIMSMYEYFTVLTARQLESVFLAAILFPVFFSGYGRIHLASRRSCQSQVLAGVPQK